MDKKVVFLDRDGTICIDTGFISSVSEVKIAPGSMKGLKKLYESGFGLVMVTNQSGIGRGFYSRSDMESVNKYIADLFHEKGIEFMGIYFCPHRPEDNCECRKPRPGMVLRASKDFGLDLKKCYIIGDKMSDILCGKSVGMKSILISKIDDDSKAVSSADYICGDLSLAADWILNNEEKQNSR